MLERKILAFSSPEENTALISDSFVLGRPASSYCGLRSPRNCVPTQADGGFWLSSYFRSITVLSLTVLCFGILNSNLIAQRPQGVALRKVGKGLMKLWLPSGVVGDTFWVYVNGRLLSSPPHGTHKSNLNFVPVSDGSGSWEGFSPEGRVITSSRLDEYLRSGDPYGIFSPIELEVSSGRYTVEMMIPGSQRGSFLFSQKSDVAVPAGKSADVYLSVPLGFSIMPLPVAARQSFGYGLCLPRPEQFDLNAASDQLIQWGVRYRNDPLRAAMMRAATILRPSDRLVTLNVDREPREYDGEQVKILIQRFEAPPFESGDIEVCRKLLPQYSETFSEFRTTIETVFRDREIFDKLAADLLKGPKGQ